MNKQELIYDLHEDHKEWTSKLDFYKDDIKILTHRLEEIASKNNTPEVLTEVERFQNQFIIQNNNIDQIKHMITLVEDIIIKTIKENPVAADHKKMKNHEDERELVDSFEKNFNLLRTEFNIFSSKWM